MKKRKITSLFLTLVMVLSLVPTMGVTSYATGWKDVTTFEQLKNEVSAGSAKIRLKANIDTSVLNNGAGMSSSDMLVFNSSGNVIDLNGYTLDMTTGVQSNFIRIISNGELKIQDSVGSGSINFNAKNTVTGAIVIPRADSSPKKGSLIVDSGTLRCKGECKNLIVCFSGNLTIDGGKFYVPDLASGTKSSYTNFALYTVSRYGDGTEVNINGGEFIGRVLIGRNDSNAPANMKYDGVPVSINNGMFRKSVSTVWTSKNSLYAEDGAPSVLPGLDTPAVEINGGTFEGSFDPDLVNNKGILRVRLNSAMFKGKAMFALGSDDWWNTRWKFLRNSVVTDGSDYRTVENIPKEEKSKQYSQFITRSSSDWFIYINGTKNPVEVLPRSMGMKDVLLDGEPISFGKNWKAPLTTIDNSTAHSVTFRWYTLPSEMVAAGYHNVYRYNVYKMNEEIVKTQLVPNGLLEGSDIHGVAQWTYTIPKGAEPSVYGINTRIDLAKLSNQVSPVANENIVRINLTAGTEKTYISKVTGTVNAEFTAGSAPPPVTFTSIDENGRAVPIPVSNVTETWNVSRITAGQYNTAEFTIKPPAGYTFSKSQNGKNEITKVWVGGRELQSSIKTGDSSKPLQFTYATYLAPVHTHSYKVKWNDVYHWNECSCGQKKDILKHVMGEWTKSGTTYTRTCTAANCGYKESYDDFSGTYKPVTNIVIDLKNYPMSGMTPHNFVHKSTDEYIAEEGYDSKLGYVLYKMTERDKMIIYPKVTVASGDEKVRMIAENPDVYTEPAKDADFLRWYKGTKLLMTAGNNPDHDKEFVTGTEYEAYVTLEAKNGYAFNSDFNNAKNFKLYTDKEGIAIDKYRVQSWYYDKGDKDPSNGQPVGKAWYTQPPEKTSKGAERVIVVFSLMAKNEGDLNITLPELKEGDDLKTSWPWMEGQPNFGTGKFISDCYASDDMMKWTDGPSKTITSDTITGNSVKTQAGKKYTLTIPATKANTLPHITVKNPEAASKVEIKNDNSVVITYEVSSDQPLTDGASAAFTDVTEKHWFSDSVQYVYEKGLMKGITEKTFEPNKPTSRAMIVTILYRLEGSPAVTGKHGFKDVKQGNWYDDPVAWAAANGIVTGYSDTEFGPSNNITREQMAAIMHRYANYKKYDTSKAGDLSAFSDKASLSSYATGSMSWAVGSGIISGKGGGNLVPRAGATRAEAAAILQRFCENTVK